MDSRERVYGALERRPVDRVPIFMWFHPETTRRLAATLEVPPDCVGDVMGNDVHQTWVNNNYAMEGVIHERDGDSHIDAWGIEWIRQYGYNQIATYPLGGASREGVLAYEFPYGRMSELFGPMAQLATSSDGYFLGCDVSPCAFEMYWRLRGMDEALVDLAQDADLAQTMLGRCATFSLALAEQACSRFALDWLWTGDDVASQTGMIISPRMWREMVKPELGRVVAVGKAKGLWVAYHCCGAHRPIIPDLVEIGVDVLNPVQGVCPGMDPLDLKREFGDHLAFMGGVDTQDLLPDGNAEEVRSRTEKLLGDMTSDGGGFILAASHSIPPETPDENIWAMGEVAGVSKEEILDRAAKVRASRGAAGDGARPLAQ